MEECSLIFRGRICDPSQGEWTLDSSCILHVANSPIEKRVSADRLSFVLSCIFWNQYAFNSACAIYTYSFVMTYPTTVSDSELSFTVIPPVTSLLDPQFTIPKDSECSTSTILVFRDTGSSTENHKKLLTCMLNKYDVFGPDGAAVMGDGKDENTFPRSHLVRCIELEPEETAGALCVQVNKLGIQITINALIIHATCCSCGVCLSCITACSARLFLGAKHDQPTARPQ